MIQTAVQIATGAKVARRVLTEAVFEPEAMRENPGEDELSRAEPTRGSSICRPRWMREIQRGFKWRCNSIALINMACWRVTRGEKKAGGRVVACLCVGKCRDGGGCEIQSQVKRMRRSTRAF